MTDHAAQDIQLWEKWDQGGRKSVDLDPLLNQLEPVIRNATGQYVGKVNIPPEAIQAKAEDLVIKGIKNFDPSKARLGTHVAWQLRSLNRFVTKYQNTARIPQHQTHKIRELQSVRDQLTDELGRPPTDYALAKKMHWSPRQVSSLRRGLTRKDLDPSGFNDFDPRVHSPSRFNEVLQLLPTELGKQERLVFEGTYGINRKPMSVAQMAKKLQVSQATTSRIRKRVADTIAKYMNVGGGT
jgi:DNA-directed RNA polymerase sigma subunit (sigma70/sigma32)